jgi:hypothetical protein
MIKRIKQSEDVDENIAVKETYHLEGILAEADRPSTHNLVYDVAGEEDRVEVKEDEGR